MNLYGFANGDPINFSDPFGLCADDDPSDPECKEAVDQLADGIRSWVARAKAAHFARNDILPSAPSLGEMEGLEAQGEYGLLPGIMSRAHRMGQGNGQNQKYQSASGVNEFVYNPGARALVTDPMNIGTANFGTTPGSHLLFDVLPWVIWGNSSTDPTTPAVRAIVFLFGPGGGGQ
jgi:hypothetical protein